MNAHAILTSQGWRGTGHSLHPTNDSQGLTHHLLIKRNEDGRGLGSKKEQQADAWWLNAFDQALKGIDTRTGTMKQTLKGGALEKIAATRAASRYTGIRGLYASFVKGGVMEGTVDDPQAALLTPPDSGAGTPMATTASSTSGGEETNKESKKESETKEERRARREAKSLRKAEKQSRKEAEERAALKAEEKKAKKAGKRAAKEMETKEERRARRDARRRRKAEKRRRKAPNG
ncbi:hypothetical protein F5X99DRAFT_116587 [Biscogniauxia marginata]|nr:hypothetical protein F5X99DRAFT_116587 [Biscogniauxia marginata]